MRAHGINIADIEVRLHAINILHCDGQFSVQRNASWTGMA
jgi:hypothetical protein